MKLLSILVALIMIFGVAVPAMAGHDGCVSGDAGQVLLMPFKIIYDVLILPFDIVGDMLGGSYYTGCY